MSRVNTALRVFPAVLLMVAPISFAHAQGICDWYAKTALRQQQDNQRMRCGFTGDSWSADLRAHLNWCAGVAPEQWKSEAQKRDQMLTQCAKKR